MAEGPPPVPISSQRVVFYQQLHLTYERNAFDNWLVWAGNLSVDIDGLRFGPHTPARAYIGPGGRAGARVDVELFVDAVDGATVRPGDVDVRLWTDAYTLEVGARTEGTFLPMFLLRDAKSSPVLSDRGNLVFRSGPLDLRHTGVFSITVQFSADEHPADSADKEWLALSELADNRDSTLVVSPAWVAGCPSVAEVCIRKTGAERGTDGGFRSGTFRHVKDMLDQLPAQVVYLLPFFKPGFYDWHTGADVRKGTLGSPYAVNDFFQLDADLVTPPERADLSALAAEGLITQEDVDDIWQRVAPAEAVKTDPGTVESAVPDLTELLRAAQGRGLDYPYRERLIQLIGRAELRALCRRAHDLGKRVIFDLVLMQTSRDSDLIEQHPEWYVLDDDGRPSIHRIAWLVYSDVALFDLVHNEPLQEYLLQIAPYWIRTCDLDGVRIDASQTVDRPFLNRIKNHINAVRPEALVLGETLCPLEEAIDVPVDMIYALMVDLHRDAERASSVISLLDEMHRHFAASTVALAYFENHDSPRATQVWYERFVAAVSQPGPACEYWQRLEAPSNAEDADRNASRAGRSALLMALLKNLQATVINATAGMAPTSAERTEHETTRESTTGGTNLAYGFELGSDWGERQRTDFENDNVLDFGLRSKEPNKRLVLAYEELERQIRQWPEVTDGAVYYHRRELPGGDPHDRVLAYSRYNADGAILILHNLDHGLSGYIDSGFDYLPGPVCSLRTLLDTYAAFGLPHDAAESTPNRLPDGGWRCHVLPLQTLVLRLL